mmetsp:Transcript_74142/g.194449  ORF Transcript_74142/g.194449 Transcript_74142/m.194449 type:complete len:120 (+) Transcript_74142:113-472(+)
MPADAVGPMRAAREALAAQVDPQVVRRDFAAADKDSSGFMEAGEVESWMREHKFSRNFNWRFFDTSRDDHISYEELVEWAKKGGVGGDGVDQDGAQDVTDQIMQMPALKAMAAAAGVAE